MGGTDSARWSSTRSLRLARLTVLSLLYVTCIGVLANLAWLYLDGDHTTRLTGWIWLWAAGIATYSICFTLRAVREADRIRSELRPFRVIDTTLTNPEPKKLVSLVSKGSGIDWANPDLAATNSLGAAVDVITRVAGTSNVLPAIKLIQESGAKLSGVILLPSRESEHDANGLGDLLDRVLDEVAVTVEPAIDYEDVEEVYKNVERIVLTATDSGSDGRDVLVHVTPGTRSACIGAAMVTMNLRCTFALLPQDQTTDYRYIDVEISQQSDATMMST